MLTKANYQSPLGEMTILCDDHFLLGLWFVQQKLYSKPYDLEKATTGTNFIIEKTIHWLDQYFQGKNPDPQTIPQKITGTPFQKQVLSYLQKIPWGTPTSYSAIAAAIHNPQAVRSIGGAVGRNPIAIIIPCHRVLGKQQQLTGYAGGIDRKIALLKLEKIPYKK